MAINFDDFKAIHNGVSIPGRARKAQSDVIMKESWWQDIQSQMCYIYDYYHDQSSFEALKLNNLHPEEDEMKTPLSIKFIRHASQTYNKDQVTFWLQMQPGQECNLDYYDSVLGNRYDSIFPIGCYVDIQHEDGTYNKWLVVDKANYNGNQFPTFEILKCDFIARWVFDGHKYECPAVLRSQNSQIVRFINESLCRKFLNCGKLLRDNMLQQKNEIYLSAKSYKKLLYWTIRS